MGVPTMTATHQQRIERLQRLLRTIPLAHTSPERCPDVGQLLNQLEDDYGQQSTLAARRRMLQRDLRELVRDERIAAVNPGGKPLRFRRVAEARDDDPAVLDFTRQQIANVVAEMVPHGRLNALWRALMLRDDAPVLDEQQLRLLPDAQRLVPAEVRPEVLSTVITAVSERRVLLIRYRNRAGERSSASLHPQALVQRGPVIYLVALENDEFEPVRFYALHRMFRAGLCEQSARVAVGFDLDQAIEEGLIDFGPGEIIELELRVRNDLVDLLRYCPLAKGQRCEDEPEGSSFQLRLWAEVPSTGVLVRWLLAGGDNLEVVAPEQLRQTVAAQAAKTANLYASETV